MKKTTMAALFFFLPGCSTMIGESRSDLPKTLGEMRSGYGYIPLDGLAIDSTLEADSCKPWRIYTESNDRFSTPSEFKGEKAGVDPFRPLMESLPDISVRFAVAKMDSSGALNFGPLKFTAKYGNYKAILDYINADAVPVVFWVKGYAKGRPIKPSIARAIGMKIDSYEVIMQKRSEVSAPKVDEYFDEVTFPVYVGVGMRLTADVTALEGKIPLVSLSSIGLAAESKKLTGTLTMQTIGIAGETAAVSLPLPSKIDQTTVENSLLAIGTNRIAIYKAGSGNSVQMAPRVVGLYSPVGNDPLLINGIYSELSKKRPEWPRPCSGLK